MCVVEKGEEEKREDIMCLVEEEKTRVGGKK